MSNGTVAASPRGDLFLRNRMIKSTPEQEFCRATVRRLRYVESRVRVRYKETDQMGIVHHSNYLVWFEIGRTDLCRATGFPYNEIESRGFILVVTEIACRFRTPYRYDDEVVIRTSVADAASRAMRFAYELYDADGRELRATGYRDRKSVV